MVPIPDEDRKGIFQFGPENFQPLFRCRGIAAQREAYESCRIRYGGYAFVPGQHLAEQQQVGVRIGTGDLEVEQVRTVRLDDS